MIIVKLDKYQTNNRANWDDRASVHAASEMYKPSRYSDDPNRISGTVRFDAPLLGDITGKSVIHLQCHIGGDTISLARLGATDMAGIDLVFLPRVRQLETAIGKLEKFLAGYRQ